MSSITVFAIFLKNPCFSDSDIVIVIGFVGILRPWHGIDILVDAFKIICDRLPGCKLLLVGDGPIQGKIEAQVEKLGLKAMVTVTGRIPHARVADYVALFDMAVSPKATFYASPMKIIEYMAQQKAVIAPDMPNIRDLICNHATGLLFKPDSVNALVEALLILIRDKSKKEHLGNGALNAVKKRLNWIANAEAVLKECAKESLVQL